MSRRRHRPRFDDNPYSDMAEIGDLVNVITSGLAAHKATGHDDPIMDFAYAGAVVTLPAGPNDFVAWPPGAFWDHLDTLRTDCWPLPVSDCGLGR